MPMTLERADPNLVAITPRGQISRTVTLDGVLHYLSGPRYDEGFSAYRVDAMDLLPEYRGRPDEIARIIDMRAPEQVASALREIGIGRFGIDLLEEFGYAEQIGVPEKFNHCHSLHSVIDHQFDHGGLAIGTRYQYRVRVADYDAEYVCRCG